MFKWVIEMKKELVIRQIYDDFTNKVILTDREKEVLIKYIKGDSIVKIQPTQCKEQQQCQKL